MRKSGSQIMEQRIEDAIELERATIQQHEHEYLLIKRDPCFPQLKIEDHQDKTDWTKLPKLITTDERK